MSKARQAADEVNRQQAGRRNFYINGKFGVWQRGTSFSTFTSADTYTADRWFMGSTHSNVTVERNASQTVNNTIVNSLKISASGSSGFDLYQAIEDYWMLSEQTCTISFWYKTNLDGVKLRHYGTTTLDTLPTTNGNWEYYSHTFTFGTLQSNPRSANGGTIGFWDSTVDVGNGDYFEFTMVQLELGSVATPFEHRSYGEELALCQRYYFKNPTHVEGGGTSVATPSLDSIVGINHQFPVTMRATPTLTMLGTATRGGADANAQRVGQSHFSWGRKKQGSGTGNCYAFTTGGYEVDAEL